MDSADDARTSLDNIRRLQVRTKAEYVRHGFARPYVLLSALAAFIMLASLDLPGPWSTAAVGLGIGLAAGAAMAQQRRAAVRRRPTGRELLMYAAVAAGLVVAYVAFAIAAVVAHLAVGLPAHHTVAAAALALTIVAGAGRTRTLLEAIVRREGRRG